MHPQHHTLFIDYCAYFNGNEDFFECHEVLEEYWKDIAPGDKNHPLVGLVQLATGLYHWRRGNQIGATRILQKALKNFEFNKESVFYEFLDFETLLIQTKRAIECSKDNGEFYAFKFPITQELQPLVTARINTLPTTDNEYLLHKHMLRDRSHILAERLENKQRKSRR
ncbi:DUF309 domain-containing protein [Lysinibacillus sp. NPDC096418]|uniref:DUF309 domain-containing protein n=1 Tax=Lysinibacillus sp. NPDC096418 TaxID=3364138 RepID=UPI00380462D8